MVPARLEPASTGLVVIDVQERLAQAMPDGASGCIANVARLVEGCAALGVRALVTEQYPKGLGPTVAAVAAALARATVAAPVLAKIAFAATDDPAAQAVFDGWREGGVRALIVCGIEAHVCVFQTVRGLRAQGFVVHVAADACASRAAANLHVAHGLWRDCGAAVTSTEAALFDLAAIAQGDAFKAISRLVR